MICRVLQWQPNSATSVPVSSEHASHFQQVSKVSVAVLKLDYANLIFTEPGAKINSQYFWEVLLMQELDLQHCWRCDCLPERQCINMSRSWQSSVCALIIPFINRDVWPANITDLNPVDCHILRCCLSEIQVAIQHSNRLFSKWSTFSGKQHNCEFCIPQGGAISFSGDRL